jgi:hypothetical protein
MLRRNYLKHWTLKSLWFLPELSVFIFVLFEIGSHYTTKADLELLSLPSAGITSVHHQVQLSWEFLMTLSLRSIWWERAVAELKEDE